MNQYIVFSDELDLDYKETFLLKQQTYSMSLSNKQNEIKIIHIKEREQLFLIDPFSGVDSILGTNLPQLLYVYLKVENGIVIRDSPIIINHRDKIGIFLYNTNKLEPIDLFQYYQLLAGK